MNKALDFQPRKHGFKQVFFNFNFFEVMQVCGVYEHKNIVLILKNRIRMVTCFVEIHFWT